MNPYVYVATKAVPVFALLALALRADGGEFLAAVVGEGTVSTPGEDVFPALAQDESILFFSRVKEGRSWPEQTLMSSRRVNGKWSEPEVLPFSGGPFSDRAPRPDADATLLYFTSNRPLPGTKEPYDPRVFNLWVAERTATGWSDPNPMPDFPGSPASEIHNSVDQAGNLYFASNREGGKGQSDIYMARRNADGYGRAVNLGAPVNTEQSQSDLFVSGDGRMMILAVTDHPTGFGGDDLFASYRRSDGWTEPVNLGPEVNTTEYEYGPYVSGEYLYFTSHRAGTGDIYRIALADISALSSSVTE